MANDTGCLDVIATFLHRGLVSSRQATSKQVDGTYENSVIPGERCWGSWWAEVREQKRPPPVSSGGRPPDAACSPTESAQLKLFFKYLFVTDNIILSLRRFTSPPPLPKVKVQNIQTVCGWEGGGVDLCWRPQYILKEFTILCLTRFRTYKIASPPQTKT